MIDVTIERSQWSRGKQSVNALLIEQGIVDWIIKTSTELNSPDLKHPKVGTMCCLGFACLAVGVTKKQLDGHGMPSEVALLAQHENQTAENDDLRNKLLKANLIEKVKNQYLDTEFGQTAAGINDDGDITEEEREQKLIDLGKGNGINFIFV